MDSEDPQAIDSQAERRHTRRIKLVTQVQCEALERNEVMITRDVSIGGMYLDGRVPLPMDSEVWVTFRLYPTDPPITCRGQVMFSRAGLGMGIKFLELTAEAHDALQRFVEEVI